MEKTFLPNGTHGLITLPTCEVLFSSKERHWKSMFVSHQYEAPFEAHPKPSDHHLLVVHLSGPVRVTGFINNISHSRIVPPGGIGFWPGGAKFGIELERHLYSLHIYINANIMAEAAQSLGLSTMDLDLLRPVFGYTDSLLEQLAIEAWNTAKSNDDASDLYVNHIARAIACRLVWISRHGWNQVEKVRPEGLQKSQIRNICTYIENNLDENLDVQRLSNVLGLSAAHFSRQFKAASGRAPHQFILELRLERAKRLLRNTTNPIAQVALECGFSHQEHLTNVFRRKIGMTPAEFRRSSTQQHH